MCLKIKRNIVLYLSMLIHFLFASSVVGSYLVCIVIVLYSCSNISALMLHRAVATNDSTSLIYVESERSITAYLKCVFSPMGCIRYTTTVTYLNF